MMSARKRLSALVVVAMLAAVGLCLSLLRPRTSPLPLELTLAGFTNSVAQGQLAVFTARNANDQTINFCTALPQTQEGGRWLLDVCFPPPAGGTDLRAHGQAQLLVPVPTNGEAWRVPVVWSFKPTMRDQVRALGRDNWVALREGRPPPGLHVFIGMTGQTAYTATIRR